MCDLVLAGVRLHTGFSLSSPIPSTARSYKAEILGKGGTGVVIHDPRSTHAWRQCSVVPCMCTFPQPWYVLDCTAGLQWAHVDAPVAASISEHCAGVGVSHMYHCTDCIKMYHVTLVHNVAHTCSIPSPCAAQEPMRSCVSYDTFLLAGVGG